MMFRVFSAVFMTLAIGCCADAGVIMAVSEVEEHVAGDFETLVAMMGSPSDSVPAPLEVEQGDFNSLKGLAGTSHSSVPAAATVLRAITLRTDARLEWRLHLVNALLPPSPVLGGLLKPS